MFFEEIIKKIEEEYHSLLEKLASKECLENPAILSKVSARKQKLEEILEVFKKIKEIEKKQKETENFLKIEKEPDLIELARDEIKKLDEEKQKLQSLIIESLLQEPTDQKNVIMEIRSGVGGEEAALFARDLFLMYSRFAEKKNWQIEILEANKTDLSGFSKIIFKVKGKDVFSFLKYESGTHRVQRVPITESGGRIHTSAATVAVFPEAKETDFKIDEKDLKIETFRSSGPGGQHANVTASAVRITHIPTKISVVCQSERSQFRNKERALSILRARLWEMKIAEEEKKKSKMRRVQIGTGDRSEKIRTYNFPQNRVTDHRINLTLYNLKEIMEGNLEELIQKLKEADFQEKIKLEKWK